MRRLTLCLFFFMFCITIHGNASLIAYWGDADPYQGELGSTWSGYYIGTFDGNDNDEIDSIPAILYWAQIYLGQELDAVLYDKVDPLPGTGENGFLTATATTFNDDHEAIGGTWSVVGPYSLGFYAVKGGPDWALYYVNPSQTEGIWTTAHVYTGAGAPYPGISHLSALPESAPVPEPATMLLLGSGLIGLAGFRKKFTK